MLSFVAGGCATHAGTSLVPDGSELPRLAAEYAARPADMAVAVRLGAGYRDAGRLDAARRVLEGARSLDPSNDAAALFLGLTYEDMDRASDARLVYEEYLEGPWSGVLDEEIASRLPVIRRTELRARVAASLRDEAALASTAPDPYTIAVFPFEYRGADERLTPLGRAFAAMLVTDLSKTDRLSVLERTDVDLLLEEVALVNSDRVDRSTAAKGGRLLGAAHVVQGLLGGRGGEGSPLTLDGALVDVVAGPDEPTALTDEARIDDVFEMEKRVAFSIYESLGIELTAAERELVSNRSTDNLQALLAFGHGLEAEALGAPDQALRHFEEAAALDPGFVEAGAALSRGAAAQATSTTTAAVAQRAEAHLQASQTDQFVGVREMLEGVETLVPTGEGRDPLEELGGLLDGPNGLRITIGRPGGK